MFIFYYFLWGGEWQETDTHLPFKLNQDLLVPMSSGAAVNHDSTEHCNGTITQTAWVVIAGDMPCATWNQRVPWLGELLLMTPKGLRLSGSSSQK